MALPAGIGAKLAQPDRFPLVAEAHGAMGELVSEPMGLERSLRAAFQAPGPTLIEAAMEIHRRPAIVPDCW